jgi:hypothetical protein
MPFIPLGVFVTTLSLEDIVKAISTSATLNGLNLARIVGRPTGAGNIIIHTVIQASHPTINMSLDALDLVCKVTDGQPMIDVPEGHVTALAELPLKLKNNSIGSFILFPNLPSELRAHVFRKFVHGRIVDVVEVVSSEGVRGLFCGNLPPFAFTISRQTKTDLTDWGVYRKIKLTGSDRILYFNEVFDRLNLDSTIARRPFPQPTIPSMGIEALFQEPLDIRFICNLHVDISAFENGFDWIVKNLDKMSKLKNLHITGQVIDPIHSSAPKTVHMSFEALNRDFNIRELYPIFCHDGEGYESPGFEAENDVQNLPTCNQRDRVLGLIGDLKEAYNIIPTSFPEKVEVWITFFAPPSPMSYTYHPQLSAGGNA